MENSIRKWIFIGGAARSGTSLLQAIFNQHSECVSPPESHLLPNYAYAPISKITKSLYDFASLKKILADDVKVQRLNISPDEVLSHLKPGLSPVELFMTYMNLFAQARNKSILVEGTPQNVWLSRRLKEQFPSSYLLHIIRDPRDVVMSTMNAEYTKRFDVSVQSVAEHYILQYECGVDIAKKLFGKHYVQVFYEDLVTNPLGEIKRICEELEVKFEPAMMEFYKSSGQVAASAESWKVNLNNDFMSNNFGKWKKGMKEVDILMIEEVCKRLFNDFPVKYQLSDLRKSKSVFFIQKALLPWHKTKVKEFLKNFSVTKTAKSSVEIDNLPTVDRLKLNGVFEPMKKY
jgi:hypothetical protein